MSFNFEKLTVYQESLLWISSVEKLSLNLKGKISYSFIDQLARASLSISLNIAEGAGRWHLNDKVNFFYIARGSIYECVSIMKTLYKLSLINEKEFYSYYNKLEEMTKMISGLINSTKKLKEKL